MERYVVRVVRGMVNGGGPQVYTGSNVGTYCMYIPSIYADMHMYSTYIYAEQYVRTHSWFTYCIRI